MNLNNTDFLEAQMDLKTIELRKRVDKLVKKSGLTGVHKAIYEAGIEAGIELIPKVLKDTMEVFAKLDEMEEKQVKPS